MRSCWGHADAEDRADAGFAGPLTNERFAQAAARLAHLSTALLGWRPHEFWSATPAELTLAIAPPSDADAGADRALVDALMARFPDEERTANG